MENEPSIRNLFEALAEINRRPDSRPLESRAERAIERGNRYLQVAFDRDLGRVNEVLPRLPDSERILVEVGTPLIKMYGARAIREIRGMCGNYVVADVKVMDRGRMEVENAVSAGADGVVCLGSSPVETLDFFIEHCSSHGVDSLIDFMNVEKPVRVLRRLAEQPDVVILHRGFDEYTNKSKQLPLAEISDIRDQYATPISVAGGVNLDDIQRAFFNGADIFVLTDSLTPPAEIPGIAAEFLKQTK